MDDKEHSTLSRGRIDAHVHLYSASDLASVKDSLPYALPDPHTLQSYIDGLIDKGIKLKLINNVHLSILPNSDNVFASFVELDQLKKKDSQRYGDIDIIGTIVADPEYATAERLSHPQIYGVRIVLHDTPLEKVGISQYMSADWESLFARLKPRQHIHVYSKLPEVNLRVLRQMPNNIPVVIDHLGTCHSERGVDDIEYLNLLTYARNRGNVWFKGPGYRTSINPEVTAEFVVQIIRLVGADKILLEATDAPHVGVDPTGIAYAHAFSPVAAYGFVDQISSIVAEQTGSSAEALLRHATTGVFPSF